MSKFELRMPGSSKPRLQLDPKIEAEMRALEAMATDGRLRRICLFPNWQFFDTTTLDYILRQPITTSPQKPLIPRGKGPAKPRAAKPGDIAKAVWQIPAVQLATDRVVGQVSDNLKRSWDKSSPRDKALVITTTAIIGGVSLAGALKHKEDALHAVELLEGVKVPIPKVHGLSFRLERFKVKKATPSPQIDYKVMVNFDIAEYLRKRQ